MDNEEKLRILKEFCDYSSQEKGEVCNDFYSEEYVQMLQEMNKKMEEQRRESNKKLDQISNITYGSSGENYLTVAHKACEKFNKEFDGFIDG